LHINFNSAVKVLLHAGLNAIKGDDGHADNPAGPGPVGR
jgi:hypothetical protein